MLTEQAAMLTRDTAAKLALDHEATPPPLQKCWFNQVTRAVSIFKKRHGRFGDRPPPMFTHSTAHKDDRK